MQERGGTAGRGTLGQDRRRYGRHDGADDLGGARTGRAETGVGAQGGVEVVERGAFGRHSGPAGEFRAAHAGVETGNRRAGVPGDPMGANLLHDHPQ